MLKFLDELHNQNLINVYYAGLDYQSLPFKESQKNIIKSLYKQSIYLKALALITDKIIIPPSFYFYFTHLIKINSNEKGLDTIKDMYQSGILISAMYENMNNSCDFIEHKLQTGTLADKELIKSSYTELQNLFKEIPLIHRNTKIQSQGFSEKLISEVIEQKKFTFFDEKLVNKIKFYNDINILERETIFDILNEHQYKINKAKYRTIYYSTNKAYYMQGAITYNAIISLVDADRYSIFKSDFFSQNRNSILIGYDPTVILELLSLFNISEAMIDNMEIKDLISIRKTKIHKKFKQEYYNFAINIQELTTVSKEKLARIRRNIIMKFSQIVNYDKKFDTIEELAWASALGIAGFFVVPVFGAILGFAPTLLSKSGLSISNYISSKLDEHNDAFKKFIEEIKIQT